MKRKTGIIIVILGLSVSVIGSLIWYFATDKNVKEIPQGNQYIEEAQDLLLSHEITSDKLGDPETSAPVANYSDTLITGANFEIIGFSGVEGGRRMAGGCIAIVYDRYILLDGSYYNLNPQAEKNVLLEALSPSTEEDYLHYVSAMEIIYPPYCGAAEPLIYLDTHYFEPYRDLGSCTYDPVDIKGGLDGDTFTYYREISSVPYSLIKTDIKEADDSYQIESEAILECVGIGAIF